MRKVINFSAGPAMLPEEVLLTAQAEMLDWHGTGMSIMEVGHRGPEFKIIAEQAEADLRELMAIPDEYHVLFLSGGATHHFAMVPMNLLNGKKSADYFDTGIWSKKAIEEAKRYGSINIASQVTSENGLAFIPSPAEWSFNSDAAYVHYTPNETIDGVAFPEVPKTAAVPLVADMTSMILSQTVDVKEYGIIYAGAQKNAGQAGLSLVIIHDDLLHDALPGTPTLYNYKILAEHQSLYNTPPTYSWYITGLVLAWMKRHGGVKAFEELNRRKANKLYTYIDANKDFYVNNVRPDCRSMMNVPFNLANAELTERFLESAAKENLKKLKGHRLSGGIRASIYNAMPEAGVDLLIDFMREFQRRQG